MSRALFFSARSEAARSLPDRLASLRRPGDEAMLGLLYANAAAAPALEPIVSAVRLALPGIDLVGAVADAILSHEQEYDAAPAFALLALPLPQGSWRMFDNQAPLPAGWSSALAHADPGTPGLDRELRDHAARLDGHRLAGGLTLGGPQAAQQIVGARRAAGGLSGVAFDGRVRTLTRVTQACAPLGPEHRITACDDHTLLRLDARPALDVMLDDLDLLDLIDDPSDGEAILRAMPEPLLRSGLLVGLSEAVQGETPGFGDYRVRHLVGIDPRNRALAVTGDPDVGQRLVFCTRDRAAARADLIRMCTEVREEIETSGWTALGGVYVSCVARGEALFGAPGAEVELLRHNLGDVPLVGFFGQAEIAQGQLHAFTGVLTLFFCDSAATG